MNNHTMMLRVRQGLPMFRGFPALLLCAALGAACAPVQAQVAMPEGMLGWAYKPFTYAKTPSDACEAMSLPWELRLKGLEKALVQGYWEGTTYKCVFYYSSGVLTYTTSLMCASGYRALWPGVCMPVWSSSPPSRPSCDASEPGFTAGDPVTLSTGVKVLQESDPVGGPSFQIARIYRSVRPPVTQTTAGGIGWSFSFERQFRAYRTSSGTQPYLVSIVTGDGMDIDFTVFNGAYKPKRDQGDSLVATTASFDEWAHTQPSGQVDYYKLLNNQFMLVSSHSREGTGMYFAYDAQRRLTSISDSFGRVLSVGWDHDEGIGSISGAGSSVNYHYDQLTVNQMPMPGMSLLAGTSVHDLSSELGGRRYLYDGDAKGPRLFLSEIIDENGARFAAFTYDAFGRATLSEHAGGADRHQFSYVQGTTTVVDPAGTERAYELYKVEGRDTVHAVSQPAGAGCGSAPARLEYKLGMLDSRTDFNNNKTCYGYDYSRMLERVRVEGLAPAVECVGTIAPGASQRKVSTQWHPLWRLATKIAAPMKVTTYVYNGQPDLDGRVLECADGGTLPDARPVAVLCKKIEQATTDPNGAQAFAASALGSPRVASFTYNRLGQILSATRFGREPGAGDTTTYVYYAETTASHTVGDLWKIRNPKGHVREFLEYSPAGLATRIKEANGQLTLLAYDLRNKITRRVASAGTPAEEVTEFVYDGAGQLVKLGAPDGSFISYAYDPAHRLTAITDSLGNAIRYTLDKAGNRVREEFFDPAGSLARKLARTYDAFNRLEQVTQGDVQ